MDRSERETVVVEGRDRNPMSWIIPLVLLVLVVLAFFFFGGFSMFSGANSKPDSVNIQTPDTIKVQPTNPQPTNPQ